MAQLRRRRRTRNPGAEHFFRRIKSWSSQKKKDNAKRFVVEIEFGCDDFSRINRTKRLALRKAFRTVRPALNQWEGDDWLVSEVLSFLNLSDVVRCKRINKRYQELCSKTIDMNFAPKKQFSNHHELQTAIKQYCAYKPRHMDKVARNYGFPIGRWDVSQLQSFHRAFYNQKDFNEDISSWDVSKAVRLRKMFCGAKAFNQPLNEWDTSSVRDMNSLFSGAISFNQPLSNWDTSAAVDMGSMFHRAKAFNQPLNNWSTGLVNDMSNMFDEASSFNQPLASWNVSSVENMEGMFCFAWRFNQYLKGWDMRAVRNTDYMFACAFSFTYLPDDWDLSNVESKKNMMSMTLPDVVATCLYLAFYFLSVFVFDK